MSNHDTKNQNTGKCPVTSALEVFGDKWSLVILRDMIFKGKKHYGEFLDSPEKISTNILANRLARLEAKGVIEKSRDTRNLSRFVYRLEDKGKDLLPLLLEVIRWSVQHDPRFEAPDNIITGAPPRLLERLHQDREALIADILSGLRETESG